jgi:hypothetical protein
MWQPWIGSRYHERKTLLLLESCYDWEENGATLIPSNDHPAIIVKAEISRPISNAPTINKLTRAVTGLEWPSPDQADVAWNQYAYTNYNPVNVGAATIRPSEESWKQAENEWPDLINLICPQTIIVMSKTCWDYMPKTQFKDNAVNPFNGNKCNEGYALASGDVAMCYVIQHPSRGLSYLEYAKFIAWAEDMRLNSSISEIK